MRTIRSRFRKENNINIAIEGKDGKEIAREIKAVLHGRKHRHNTSYQITIFENFPQSEQPDRNE